MAALACVQFLTFVLVITPVSIKDWALWRNQFHCINSSCSVGLLKDTQKPHSLLEECLF